MAATSISAGVDDVRQHRTWLFVWGIVLIILGLIAIGSSVLTTLISVLLLGWILILSGFFDVIHGLTRRRWHGFFLNLLTSLLYAVVGFLMVSNPALAAATLTLLIATLLAVAGIFRLIIGLSVPFDHNGWLVLNGVVAILLNLSIWRSWPISGLWVIGLFVGINLVVDGWTEVMLAVMSRPLPVRSES